MELFSHTPLDHAPNHGLRTPGDQIPNSLQPTQNHIPNSNRKLCKMYVNLGFLQKKMIQYYSSMYYQKYPNSANLFNWPKYLGYFKKSSHWVSVVREPNETTKFVSFSELFTIHYYTPVKFQAFLLKNILTLKYPACRGFSFLSFFCNA